MRDVHSCSGIVYTVIDEFNINCNCGCFHTLDISLVVKCKITILAFLIV